jgi:hypothetical protein
MQGEHMSDKQQETIEKHEQSDIHHSQLILDLNGPFVLHVKNDKVCIHAPICPEHFANLLTDTNDISMSGLTDAALPQNKGGKGWVYELSFDSKSDGACQSNPGQMLRVTYPFAGIAETNCSFVFIVPRPDTIVALHPEPIWIHQRKALRFVDDQVEIKSQVVDGHRARGLRLVYRDCYSNPEVENTCFPTGETPVDFKNVNFWTQGVHPAYRSMCLRFAANHATSDEHHEDAYNCFQNMRVMVAGSDPDNWDIDGWRVDFCSLTRARTRVRKDGEEPLSLLNLTGKHPNDCGALMLVIQDSQ